MTKLIVSSATGFGKCINKNGTELSVVRAEGLWNLGVKHKGEFHFWAKENVKRISTLQKVADERGYDIQIEVV